MFTAASIYHNLTNLSSMKIDAFAKLMRLEA